MVACSLEVSRATIFRIVILTGKVLVPFCLVAAVGYCVIFLLSPWLFARRISTVDPRMHVVPQDLPTRTEDPLSETVIRHYGFSFRLPGKPVTRIFSGDSMTLILLEDGQITLRNPLMDALLAAKKADVSALKLIDADTLSSEYEL